MEEQSTSTKKTKTLKSRRESAVQGTNDSSIVSKCSMANLGYFDDPYLQCFVSKVTRRAPLIHRGYYVRAKTLDYILKKFLTENSGQKQIISLGAGFDSAYFRLHSQKLLKETIFYEIDFPEVVKRKHALIKANDEILTMVGEIDPVLSAKSPLIEMSTACYKLIGVDLSQLNTLEAVLTLCNIDLDVPTLCLSECVMTYMTRRCASNVVRWAAETFNNGMFVLYEQINPDDAFGLFMQNHFHTVGSPLKSINAFPTLQAQRDRFTKLGWNDVTALDMNQFYFSLLPTEERERIENIELFDEYEEWHLKCAHYMVLCGYQGNCARIIGDGVDCVEISSPAIEEVKDMITYEKVNLEKVFKLFGHGTADCNEKGVVCVGGFGEQNGKHMRVTDITIVERESLIVSKVKVAVDNSKLQVSRMHATVTYLKDGSLILIGGRLSPMRLCTQIVSIKIDQKQGTSQQEVAMEENQSTSDDMKSGAFNKGNGDLGRQEMNTNIMNCENNEKSANMNCEKEMSEMNFDEKKNLEMNFNMDEISKMNFSDKENSEMNCEKSSFDSNSSEIPSNSNFNVNSDARNLANDSNKENINDTTNNKENEIMNCNQDKKVPEPLVDNAKKVDRNSRKVKDNSDEATKHLYDENVIIESSVIEQKGEIPCPRWRHSAMLYDDKGEETVIIFGGRTQTVMALGDCFKYVPRTSEWTKINMIGQSPSPRHTHTASFWKGHMIIAGGLQEDLQPLSSVYMLDLETKTWKLLPTNIKPRYAHSAHVIGDFLVLVGGVNCHHSPPGVAIVHLPTGKNEEFALPKQDKNNLIMLHRHTSVAVETNKIVILGGGGNCFSFGTHLNSSPFVIDLTEAMNYVKRRLDE